MINLQNQLKEQLTAHISQLSKQYIELLTNGFIVENCSLYWLPIYVHCIENAIIFDNVQLNNILNDISTIQNNSN